MDKGYLFSLQGKNRVEAQLENLKKVIGMKKNDNSWGGKSKTASLLVLLMMFFISIQQIHCNDSGRDIVIVFDASGSMEYPISTGERKIDVAKDAVNDFLEKLTSNDRVALIVFHGCESEHIQIEAGFTNSRSVVTSAVAEIEPYGDTPIGDSLLYAWDYLKNSGERNHSWYIVIFTDGEETCSGDPCHAADVIASESSSYADTPVYAIGFFVDSNPEAEADLKCIAQRTGGRYFPASSSEELGKAFENVAEEITPDETEAAKEILIFTAITAIVLSGLLVMRALFLKHGKRIEHEPRRKRKSILGKPPKRETAILWGTSDEQDDEEEYTEEGFVKW